MHIGLAGLSLYDLELAQVPEHATSALAHARGIEDRRLEHAALAMLALGHACAGRADDARAPLDAALELFADVDADAMESHSQGFWDLGWALTGVGRYEEALGELRRAVAIDRRTGHGYFIPALLAAQLQALIQLGRLAEAISVGEEAVDAAWTSHNPILRLGAHGDLALARHLAGDPDGAHREALEAVRLAPAGRLWRGRAGWTLGLIEADGRPEDGIATILGATGGPDCPTSCPPSVHSSGLRSPTPHSGPATTPPRPAPPRA